MKESALELKFKKACEKRGYVCLKLDARGNAGVPDRLVVGERAVLFVEVKKDRQAKPSKLQSFVARQLKQRDHYVLILDDESEIGNVLNCLEALEEDA